MIIQNDDELNIAIEGLFSFSKPYIADMLNVSNNEMVDAKFIVAITSCAKRDESSVLAIYKYHLQTISYATERIPASYDLTME